MELNIQCLFNNVVYLLRKTFCYIYTFYNLYSAVYVKIIEKIQIIFQTNTNKNCKKYIKLFYYIDFYKIYFNKFFFS